MAQAIVHRSRTKLRSAIEGDNNTVCWNFASDLREMMKVLEVIEPAVEGAERYSLCDEASREWLKRVRKAAYGISDMVDELQDTRPRPMAVIFIGPKKNPMSNRMKEMKLELRTLQESHRFASQKPHPDLILSWPPTHPNFTQSSTQMSRAHGRVTDRRADEVDIVGRDENKQAIIDTLSDIDTTKGSAILPIFGLAAIGKTTLAKMVFEDTGFEEYKLRIWVDVTPKFDLADIGNHIISKILEHLEMDNQRDHGPYLGNQVPKKDSINTYAYVYTDADRDIDGSSQESEGRFIEFTMWEQSLFSNVPLEINKGSDEACQVSEEEINISSDGACQVSEEDINEGSDGACQVSEQEINESSDGACQVSEEDINEGSDGACQVSEQEINESSDGACHVSEDVMNTKLDWDCQVSEDEISISSDGVCEASEDEINTSSYGACQVSEDEINTSSYGACQLSEDEINKSTDGACQASEDEINKSTDGACQVSEDEINKGSDGTFQVLAEEINKGSCEISEVLEDREINCGIDAISQVSEEEIRATHPGSIHNSQILGSPPRPSFAKSIWSCSNDDSDETSQVSEEEIIQCSNNISLIPEEEIHEGSDDVDNMTKHLHELLNGMKTLIVLDDLWEEDSGKLKCLKHLLGVGIKGSKVTVIVTTCNEGIARKVFTVKPYKLDPLTDDMCWEIIKQSSDFGNRTNSDKQELERIGLKIASKCGGLPLAAQELGHSLCNGDVKSWAEAMKRDIWSNIRSNSDVTRSLELSYRSMPQDLRLCFAYCAIFAQGDRIVKDDIIHQWIALGLVVRSVSLSVTQVADEYIRRLLDISFLQTAKSSAPTNGNGDMGAILLTMHETAHALARSLGDELIVLDGRMGTSDQNNCCRYALLSDFEAKLSSKLPTQLRALRCVGCSKRTLADDAFSFTGCLRVLHLNDCSMQKLPDSICQLRQLGYLNLSGCSRLITLPESFGDLLNLQYINLSRCYGLAELPESFQKLRNLLHLDLSFWCCFEGIPVLGGLTSLQYLNLSHPCCYRPQHRPHIEGLNNVLCKLINLQYLNLSMCMNSIFCYWSEEQCCEYIQSCTSSLSNLKHLDLSHNIFLVGLPESLGELQKLHTLDLMGCIRLKSVAKRIRESDSLERIVIWDCRDLESCSFVVHTDDGGFGSDLVHLENLIVNCQDLEITCLENVKSKEEAHRIRLVEKRKLKKLTLSWTAGSQRSVEDDANLLAELEPPHDLQHLELHCYNGTCHPAWVSSISSHLPNLMEVTMEDFPRCSSLPPFAKLPNLQRLVLRRMASITRIDAGELSGGNTTAAALRGLSNFTIDDMESLEEFNTTYYGGSGEELCMFAAIDELVIQRCSKLRFRSLPPRARRLVILDCPQVLSSSWLLVSDCDQVMAFQRKTAAGGAPVAELVIHGCIADWSLLGYLAGLERLSISNCKGMTSLPQHMGALNSLHDLQIVCCKQLKRFPDSMRHLTSLQSLHFSECDRIKKFAKWFKCLTSLQKLSIHKCHAFEFLPRSIKRLENLNELHIVDCERLMIWCQKNQEKLGLIKPKYGLEDQAQLEKKRQELERTRRKKEKEPERATRSSEYTIRLPN